MARPPKTGLNYFPLYVDFFDDPKIAAVTVEHGTMGQAATIMLLCHIYRNGYYIEWTPQNCVTILKELPGITLKNMEKIVKILVEWGFFDSDLFEQHHVLTSRCIQEQYMTAARRRKNAPNSNMPFWLEKQDAETTSIPKPAQPFSQTAVPQTVQLFSQVAAPKTASPLSQPDAAPTPIYQEATEIGRKINLFQSEKRIANADTQGIWIANPPEQKYHLEQMSAEGGNNETGDNVETVKTAELLQSKMPLMSAEIPQEDNIEINKINYINPSPSTARAREIETKEAIRQLNENEGWMVVMCMKHHLDKPKLSQLIREFATDCECRGKLTHESISDTQSHFCNWLLIRQKQESQQKQATLTTPNIYGYQYRRRTSAEYIAEAQQYAIEATERFIREAEIKRGGVPPHLPF